MAEAGSETRLDLLVARRLDLSRTAAATLIANGNVTVAGRSEKASYRPVAGESVDVVIPPPETREILPEKIDLSVVHEDEFVIVRRISQRFVHLARQRKDIIPFIEHRNHDR